MQAIAKQPTLNIAEQVHFTVNNGKRMFLFSIIFTTFDLSFAFILTVFPLGVVYCLQKISIYSASANKHHASGISALDYL